MGKRGVNPKRWFYGFSDHLEGHGAHARRALAGSAAEQWLNMELNAFLLGSLRGNLYAYPEAEKHDVTVFSFSKPEDPESEHEAEAIIETKVIYRQYSTPSIAERVRVMARQLDRGHAPKAVGLVLGVWADWQNDARPRKHRTRRKLDLPGFRMEAGEAVRLAANAVGYAAAKPTMETLLSPGLVSVGPWSVEIALVGQYFVRN